MNWRALFSSILLMACAAAVGAVYLQRQRIASLRMEQQRLVEATASSAASAANPTPQSAQADLRPRPPLELLRLRGEVTRLAARQRELAKVPAENEQLRAQLAARGTNGPAAFTLPPGYVLSSQAQWVGLDSPENAMQSFLWAMHQGDFTNLLQVVTPESARQFQERANRSEEFLDEFRETSRLFAGMRIVDQTLRDDGSIEARVEILPGQVFEQPFTFRQVDGQWKLDMR